MRNNITRLKEQYKPGTKVQLIFMDDTQAPPSGTKGIISFVDDIGTIHVQWETGSSLGLVYKDIAAKPHSFRCVDTRLFLLIFVK